MRGSFDERLVELFRRELQYLRHAGADFGQRYPKIASRLELSEGESADPHVERLLESFAFLTARLQSRMEADFPEVPLALIDSLFPYLAEGVPPLAIAQFDTTRSGAIPPPAGVVVPRGTQLYAQADARISCRFRTCYDLDLRPIAITDADLEPVALFDFFDAGVCASVLRLRLSPLDGSLREATPDRLRIHLAGNQKLAMDLYELILTGARSVALVDNQGKLLAMLGADAVGEVGFAAEEAVLPDRDNAPPGYRLLLEYFNFPEKFLFFDLKGLRDLPESGHVDILIGLASAPAGRVEIEGKNFRLHCAPVINLFQKTAEPIRIRHTAAEYLILPELEGDAYYEVHGISAVTLSSPAQQGVTRVQPYFGFDHHGVDEDAVFWHIRRSGAGKGLPGTDTYISFKESRFKDVRPPGETATVRTWCTNRSLTEQLPTNAALQADTEIPATVFLMTRPTLGVPPVHDGEALWRLVSQLSLNQVSLVGGAESLTALQELLMLYCPPHRPAALSEVRGLRRMNAETVVRRLGREGWRGFCQGVQIDIEVDERHFVGSNPYLLGAVLNRFLALHASVNAFTELVLRSTQREGIWKRWAPMIGTRPLI